MKSIQVRARSTWLIGAPNAASSYPRLRARWRMWAWSILTCRVAMYPGWPGRSAPGNICAVSHLPVSSKTFCPRGLESIIRVAPRAHADDAPYAIAAVRLREGVSLLGRVVDVPLDALAVGLPVRFRPIVVKDRSAVGFGPA